VSSKDLEIRVGIIGCGYWGPNLIRNFRSTAGTTVPIVCDLDSSRLAHMAKTYPGIRTTTDFQELLEMSDAVAIVTPVRHHFKMAKESLQAGKHTFIEKPMAASSAQCQELNDLSKEKKVTLMVGHTFIYSAPVRKIKEIIESGEIGDLLYVSSQRLNLGLFQQDINVTWDLAPHDISIILHIMGKRPLSVNCQGKAHFNPKIEDITTVSLEFPENGFATINNSWLDPNKVRSMTFVGSKKMIVYDDTQPLEKIKIYDKGVEAPPYYDTFAGFQFSYRYGDIYTPYIQQNEPLSVQCHHFIDCIRSGEKPISSGVEGLEVVRVLEGAAMSLTHRGCNILFNWEDDGGKFLSLCQTVHTAQF
jgi:predicted dehydrogenase